MKDDPEFVNSFAKKQLRVLRSGVEDREKVPHRGSAAHPPHREVQQNQRQQSGCQSILVMSQPARHPRPPSAAVWGQELSLHDLGPQILNPERLRPQLSMF